MALRRDDLALQQFALLESQGPLTPSQTVLYVKSLLADGKFERAEQVGESALDKSSALTIAQKLEVARSMVILGSQESTWPVLKQLPKVENLSEPEAIALLKFLMEIGSYAQATSLATHQEALLAQSAEGLLTVADLYLRLGQVDEALKQAELAKALSSNDYEVLAFIIKHTTDRHILEDRMKQNKVSADDKNSSATAALRFAEAVVRLGQVESTAIAIDQLAAVNKRTIGIPESFFLLGQLQRLQKHDAEAVVAFNQAGKLSPAYIDPFLQLADYYQSQNDTKRAIAALDHVARFSPDNADAWKGLAQLYRADGNLYEAVTYFQNAIQFRPNDLPSYLALAEVFLELRAPEESQRVLAHAATIDPENKPILALLLKTLYDPALEASTDDKQQLKLERQSAVEALRQVDSAEADRLLSELQKPNALPETTDAGDSRIAQ